MLQCFLSMPFNYIELLIGAAIGLVLTMLYEWIKVRQERASVQELYCGKWLRDDHFEYSDNKRDDRLLNRGYTMEIKMTGKSPRGLTITIEYNHEDRGTVQGHLEVNPTNHMSAEGPYTYPIVGDKAYGNAGWYRMQLRNEQTVILYYEGGHPVRGAAGWEVFKKIPLKP